MNAHSLQPVLDFVLRERGWEPSARLARLAAQLPPVPCAGLELHLGRRGAIDLQQRVKGPAEHARLRRFLHGHPAAEPQTPWAALARFCEQDSAAELADELWLELDDDPTRNAPPVSIFARLPEAARANGPAELREAAIRRLLAAFALPLSGAAGRALRHCLRACRDGAGPSHVGMMLGRAQAPLRLIVEQVAADDFGGYLDRAGLGHRAAAVQRRADALFVHADRIRLALTLTERLEDAVGLECFVGDPTKHDPRWPQLFDYLLRIGCCTPKSYERLLAWPTQILPHRARESWPGLLIAQALGDGGERLSWLDCRISHVKLTIDGSDGDSAKAYVGFVQETRDLRAAPAPAAQSPSRRPRATSRDDVSAKAHAALLDARNQAGWWLDYPGFGEGISDEWVTAYVATTCNAIGTPQLRAAAERAWSLLSGRPRTGWGWNYVQPPDADSTAWALRLAQSLGRLADPQAQQGLAFLKRHIGADGGVTTYLPGSHAARCAKPAINEGWHRVHLCVTAAVAGLAPLADAPLSRLLRSQQPDGSWLSYWWADQAYATATAAAALATRPDEAAAAATLRAARWAHERLKHDIGLREAPFVLALLLRTALHLPEPDAGPIEQGLHDLAAAQRPDGMWTGSAMLRIPNGSGALIDATDGCGIFTTATALQTLSAFRRAGYPP